MRFARILGLGALLAFASAAAQSAHAVPVTQSIFGVVGAAAADNDLEIKAGDILRGTLTFDAALLVGSGKEALTAGTDPTLTLHIEFAGFEFDLQDDPLFPDFPEFEFLDGELVDINFVAMFSLARGNDFVLVFNDGAFDVTSVRQLEIIAEGEFSIVSAVPEPMSAALLGLGLAGVRLIRGRRA
jgi:hypothetical protein